MYEFGRNPVVLRKLVKRSCLIIDTESITTIGILNILVKKIQFCCSLSCVAVHGLITFIMA